VRLDDGELFWFDRLGPGVRFRDAVIAIVESILFEGQNFGFATPIDYAAGMLDSRQTHPLEGKT
jgi:hypothetical protein